MFTALTGMRARRALLLLLGTGALFTLAACVPFKTAPPAPTTPEPAPTSPPAPVAPTVNGMSPNRGPEAGGNSINIIGTSFSGTTAVAFGAMPATSFTVDSSTDITATAPAGTGTVDVAVTTPAGTSANTASDNYIYAPVPTVTALAPTFGSAAGGNSVAITGTGFEVGVVNVVTAVHFGTTPAASFAPTSATQITATAPAGTGPVDVTVTTGGGTSANTANDDYTYGPTVTAVSPIAGPVVGSVVTLTGTGFIGTIDITGVTFDGANAASFSVVNDTTIMATTPAHAAGTVDVVVTTPIASSPTSGTGNDYRYAPVPTVGSVSSSGGNVAGGNTVFINGSGLTGTSAVTFGGTAATDVNVLSDLQLSVTAPAHASGPVDVAVTTPGGTNANTAGDDYTYFPTPTVTGLNPAGGPEAGGNNVTITGTGFTGATSVVFGSSGATNVVVMNDTTITVDAPAGTNTAAVRVGTPGGSSANTPADFYTYAPVPTVTGVSPASGGTAGGTTVTVTGTGFRVGGVNVVTQVTFGGTVAVCNAPIIETEVTCTSPNHAPGPVTVTVTTYGGSSPSNAPSDLFVYTV